MTYEIDRIRRLYSERMGKEPEADRALALTLLTRLKAIERAEDCSLLRDEEPGSFYVVDFEEFVYDCRKEEQLAKDLFERLVKARALFRQLV